MEGLLKQEFEEWFKKSEIEGFKLSIHTHVTGHGTLICGIESFYELPLPMRWGVLQDFYRHVNLDIQAKCNGWYSIIDIRPPRSIDIGEYCKHDKLPLDDKTVVAREACLKRVEQVYYDNSVVFKEIKERKHGSACDYYGTMCADCEKGFRDWVKKGKKI